MNKTLACCGGHRLVTVLVAGIAALVPAQGPYWTDPTAWPSLPLPGGVILTGPHVLTDTTKLVDVNNDGILDLVAGSDYPSDLLVFLGTAPRTFAAPLVQTLAPVGGGVGFHHVGDYNADGNVDFVVGANGALRTLLGNGDGTFFAVAPIVGAQGYLDFGDLDGDGIADLAAPGPPGMNEVRIFPSLGGGFPLTQTVPIPEPVAWCRISDVNGDGLGDVIVSGGFSLAPTPTGWTSESGLARMYVLMNGGPAGFTVQGPFVSPSGNYSQPNSPFQWSWDHWATDVNQDGYGDLVMLGSVPGSQGLSVRTWFGGSQGLKTTPVTQVGVFTAYYFSAQSRLVDIDVDGRKDILFTGTVNLAPSYPTEVNVLRNNGDGSWTRIASPSWVAGYPLPADTDQDGDADIYLRFGGGASSYPLSLRGSENLTITGPGIAGGAGVPQINVGLPRLGNASFAVSLSNAAPNALCGLGLSLGRGVVGTPPNAIWLDPAQLFSPVGSTGLFMTDALGSVAAPMPIPNDPLFTGFEAYAQWIVVDPQGLLPLPGGSFFATSPARKIVVY